MIPESIHVQQRLMSVECLTTDLENTKVATRMGRKTWSAASWKKSHASRSAEALDPSSSSVTPIWTQWMLATPFFSSVVQAHTRIMDRRGQCGHSGGKLRGLLFGLLDARERES